MNMQTNYYPLACGSWPKRHMQTAWIQLRHRVTCRYHPDPRCLSLKQ